MDEKHSKGPIKISKAENIQNITIELPASKSIANRALIVNSLSKKNSRLLNISNANDTVLMQELISSNSTLVDTQDAGTTTRFLTAFFAVQNKSKIITGTERMKLRPIGILVDSLRKLGCQIEYLEKEGFLPLEISPFKKQLSDNLMVPADVSSQYISALMMIGPVLDKGLSIELTGTVGSKPYIEMTMEVMKSFGANVHFNGTQIEIKPGGYNAPESYTIEPDWSAASYWYSILAIAQQGEITLKHLTRESIQGDHVIADLMNALGIQTKFTEKGAILSKSPTSKGIPFKYDFTDCPDLAQTIAVVCAAKGIPCEMTGLESLRIKETDRIEAIRKELSKFGIEVKVQENAVSITGEIQTFTHEVSINTYKDHRMAMAFAPLCLKGPLQFDEAAVVIKSYPHFWEDLTRTIIT